MLIPQRILHQKSILCDGLTYSLYFWDLDGKNRFRFMPPSYVLGSKGAMLMYATTRSARRVHPEVIKVMREKGIDLSHTKPQKITNTLLKGADAIITMGCGASDLCPVFLLKKVVDWHLDDPHGQPLDKERAIRDEIERCVRVLIAGNV